MTEENFVNILFLFIADRLVGFAYSKKGAYTYVREIQCKKTIYRAGGGSACDRAWGGILYQNDYGPFAQYQPAVCDRHDALPGGKPGNRGNGGDQAGGSFYGNGKQY